MRPLPVVLALALAAPAVAGCASGRRYAVSYDPTTKAGVLSVWGNLVEDFGEKFDVNLHIKNDSAGTLLVRADDIRMFRGDMQAQVKAGRWNLGEELILGARVFAIPPGQTQTAKITGVLPTIVPGPFRVLITHVWSNPTGDGKAMGEIVARDVEWRYSAPR